MLTQYDMLYSEDICRIKMYCFHLHCYLLVLVGEIMEAFGIQIYLLVFCMSQNK